MIIVLIGLFLGGNSGQHLRRLQLPHPDGDDHPFPALRNDEMSQFVSVVLADTEDFWTQQFTDMGHTYEPPKLVLFTG